jgi:glutamyl/glutaminyl-tRNA synthetase
VSAAACRIEDTDTARSTRESEEKMKADLEWLGLNWDEGEGAAAAAAAAMAAAAAAAAAALLAAAGVVLGRG